VRRRFYPRKEYRDLTHVSLMVRPEDLREVLRYLGRGGYRSLSEADGIVTLSRSAELPSVKVYTSYFQGDSPVLTEAAWEHSHAADFPRLPKRFRSLSNEEFVVYTVRKAIAGGNSAAYVNLNDLYFMIKSQKTLDWSMVLARLEQFGVTAPAWFVFEALKLSFGAELPEALMSSLEKTVPKLRRDFFKQISENGDLFNEGVRSSFGMTLKRQYAVKGTWGEAIRSGVIEYLRPQSAEPDEEAA
jgi:hypothetical protein